MRRAMELMNINDAEANRGADDAAALYYYQLGVLKNEATHPLVVTGTEMARATGDTGRINVFAMMYIASFYREISERLNPDN